MTRAICPISRLLPAIASIALAFPPSSNAEWYTGYGSGKPDKVITFKETGKSFAVPLYQVDLQVTELILRQDTERADYYWLEATLAEYRDSDCFLLVIGELVMGQIYTRGSKWAVGFESPELGRHGLEHLRKLHHLQPERVRDTTKG